MTDWRRYLSPGMWQGPALVLAITFAYALDYLFNLVAGRLLVPAEFSIVVALSGVGQVLVVASRVIQTVVTRYVSQFQAEEKGAGRTASFFVSMFRASWRWGALLTAIMLLLSLPLARFLQIESLGPVLALTGTTILMVVRPVVGGTLQGAQQFGRLGLIQITQAALRLLGGALLMWLGWGALGAMVALPLASLFALILGLTLLRPLLRMAPPGIHHQVSLPDLFHYSTYAAAGLIGFALTMNMDAILVRRFFDPAAAGNYSAAITLAKIIQFFPVAVIMILFPKAAQRQAAHQDSGRVLLVAMAVVGLISGGIALIYALFPTPIVRLTLGEGYEVSGLVLGLLGGAMLLLSLSNVWLNYFLSIGWTPFVYLIFAGILFQGSLMFFFHEALWQLPAAMAANGLWLTVAGGLAFWRTRPLQRQAQQYAP